MTTKAKIGIVITLAMVVVGAVALKNKNKVASDASTNPKVTASATIASSAAAGTAAPSASSLQKLPKLLDLGAGKCIPCKMMAPILDKLKEEFADTFEVQFIDVWENRDAGKKYGIEVIPTQIFYDADGKERFRHVGFFGREDILNKWQELGVDISGKEADPIVREEPVEPDTRPHDQVCVMCDGDVNPKTKILVKGQTEQRILCSPHCYFIYFSSIPGADPETELAKVSVTDWSTGKLAPASSATYLYGLDAKGRATTQAFATKEAASKAQKTSPGGLIGWDVLRSKELAIRCGFCDRAVYPEDACKVTVGGNTHTYGCCTHCSLGVAARTGKNIEVEAYDGFNGDIIRVKTLNGSIASMEPPTAIAWFGQKKTDDGKWKSGGCFKQGFFVNQDNLGKWLEARPAMIGRQITIAKALANKMKLTPEQIAKACKLGECK